MPVQPVPARFRVVTEDTAMSWKFDYKDKGDHKRKHDHDHDKDYHKKDDWDKKDDDKDYGKDYRNEKKRRHCDEFFVPLGRRVILRSDWPHPAPGWGHSLRLRESDGSRAGAARAAGAGGLRSGEFVGAGAAGADSN